jgi:very-short-patch-repair endonuclease
MREKKDQTRIQDITEFGLKYLRFRNSQPLTIEVEPKH